MAEILLAPAPFSGKLLRLSNAPYASCYDRNELKLRFLAFDFPAPTPCLFILVLELKLLLSSCLLLS